MELSNSFCNEISSWKKWWSFVDGDGTDLYPLVPRSSLNVGLIVQILEQLNQLIYFLLKNFIQVLRRYNYECLVQDFKLQGYIKKIYEIYFKSSETTFHNTHINQFIKVINGIILLLFKELLMPGMLYIHVDH